MQRSRERSYQKQMGLKAAREKNERELNMKTKDITRKYKQYLQKKVKLQKNQMSSNFNLHSTPNSCFPDEGGVHEEGSFDRNVVLEHQMVELPESKEVNNESLQDNFDRNNSGSPIKETKQSSIRVKQYRETAGGVDESMKYARHE
ncbi:hypothetical protein LOAG_01598 [Loa loa]|uniref:Uncharacterized protein n=1 Tax=Loa loa TaxID=7209 RepID=A0A1S0U9A0_LOALO|nr:hypothetical protein LOAG_01598 [Loa loa]EFO26890.1 hypothetical protein LOAG_01598 [Loa loa]